MAVSEELQDVILYIVKDTCRTDESKDLIHQQYGRWSAVISSEGASTPASTFRTGCPAYNLFVFQEFLGMHKRDYRRDQRKEK